MALARLSPSTTLHTFLPDGLAADAATGMVPLGINLQVHACATGTEFYYLHPLARPRVSPFPGAPFNRVDVAGEAVLRFGCLDGDFRVDAEAAVYDPQSGSPVWFHENGSTSRRLAMVLNANELFALTRSDDLMISAPDVIAAAGLEVLVVKCGPKGAWVFEPARKPVLIPAYETSAVFKIGSGDIFSAVFAHCWTERGLDGEAAADAASRRTADYVESRRLPIRGEPNDRLPGSSTAHSIRVAVLPPTRRSPLVDWLVSECLQALIDTGHRAETIAGADTEAAKSEVDLWIALLPERNSAAIAWLIEAHQAGAAVAAFVEDRSCRATMRLLQAGVNVHTELSTMVYHISWGS